MRGRSMIVLPANGKLIEYAGLNEMVLASL